MGRAIATDAMAKELGIEIPQLGKSSAGTDTTATAAAIGASGRGVIARMHDAIETLNMEKEALQQCDTCHITQNGHLIRVASRTGDRSDKIVHDLKVPT